MAIRVEKKRGPGWWVWALLALVLAALIALLLFAFGVFDNGDEAAEEQPAAAAGGNGAITDVDTIFGTQDAGSLVGRQVQLSGVEVQSVVGDKTFWVGPSEEEQLFVFLEEEQDAGGVEGRVDVEAGQTITLAGTIQEVPDQPQQEFDLSEENSAQLTGEQIYVRAESVSGAS